MNRSTGDREMAKADVIEKANGYGNKIPVKKETADGRMITYWVSPEDLNASKNKGQQNLFDIDDIIVYN